MIVKDLCGGTMAGSVVRKRSRRSYEPIEWADVVGFLIFLLLESSTIEIVLSWSRLSRVTT